MAQSQPSSAPAPFPDRPGAGRGASLPRDPGRATELLYRRHGTTVFRFAWHLLGRREDAEDATQATFLAVHGSLTHGTAVLEPRAWVLRIARNECMGRLRRSARLPTLDSLDAVEVPAAGGVERSAELRDEVRVARSTLGGLAVEEREAFVLREWLGLETREVALALGLTIGAVDGLAGRARRSLVLAVGGLEAPAGCAGTRSALETGSLDRAVKVHLLRCPMCRGVRRALRPPEETVGRLVPIGVIAERLADAVPGFATGGGGIIAALTAKAAAAPFAAKTAALVAAALVTAGVARQEVVDTSHHARSAVAASARGGEARSFRLPAATTPTTPAHVAVPTRTVRPTVVAYTARPATPKITAVRGGVALDDSRHGHGKDDLTARERGDSSPGHGGGPGPSSSRTRGGSDDGSATVARASTSGSQDDSGGDSGGDPGGDGGSQRTVTSHGTISATVTTGQGSTSSGGGGSRSDGSDGSSSGSGSGSSGSGSSGSGNTGSGSSGSGGGGSSASGTASD